MNTPTNQGVMMCEVSDARDRLLATAVRVARLIGEDPDGDVLDRAHTRFLEAEAAYMALWTRYPHERLQHRGM